MKVECGQIAQAALSLIETWGSHFGLEVECSKTKLTRAAAENIARRSAVRLTVRMVCAGSVFEATHRLFATSNDESAVVDAATDTVAIRIGAGETLASCGELRELRTLKTRHKGR